MKLSNYAKKVGVRYETAWRWFKAGYIKGYQLPTGTIIITEGEPIGIEEMEHKTDSMVEGLRNATS